MIFYSSLLRSDFVCPDQISFGLIRFFDQLKLEDSKWKWCRALKCINQEVIFPGVMALRKAIYYSPDNQEKFPFQDSKNTWKIRVVAAPEGCTVIHHKVHPVVLRFR